MGASLLLAVLVETVGPALRDPLPGPDVVRVFGEPVHQLLHLALLSEQLPVSEESIFHYCNNLLSQGSGQWVALVLKL